MKARFVTIVVGVSLLSAGALAQEGEAPPTGSDAPSAPAAAADPAAPSDAGSPSAAAAPVDDNQPPAKALASRFYVAPMGSFTVVDGGRQTDNGYGGNLAMGFQSSDVLSAEVNAQYSRMQPAKLWGATANLLMFPTAKHFYLLGGLGYGRVTSQPGDTSSYGAVLFNAGVGYLWGPYKVFGFDLIPRTQVVYRLDAHNPDRSGDSIENGRRDFNDIQLSVGFVIPIGAKSRPYVQPAAEPLPAVVPVE